MRLEQYINELFDTKVDIKVEWQDLSDLRYSFVINDKVYTFDADNEKGTWEIDFTLRSKATTQITGSGNAPQVFAAVKECLNIFLKKRKPYQFWFTAKEPSRKKLYKMMSKLITRKYPYTFKIEKKSNGDDVFFFTRKS
jgi:hypothetical protein